MKEMLTITQFKIFSLLLDVRKLEGQQFYVLTLQVYNYVPPYPVSRVRMWGKDTREERADVICIYEGRSQIELKKEHSHELHHFQFHRILLRWLD